MMGPTLLVYAGIFTTTVLMRAPVSGAFIHQQATVRCLAREGLPLCGSHVDGTRSNLNLVISRDRSSRLNLMARRNGVLEENREITVEPSAAPSAVPEAVHRKRFLDSIVTATVGSIVVGSGVFVSPREASANGMLDFPPAKLNNRYFVMRAAQGGADREGLIQSHPIDKLRIDNGLTEQGVAEAQRAADVLRAVGVDNAFIWADISSRAQGTARILAQELNIRQERVVPEYSFLDPRGMGIFDGKEAASVLPEVYKADATNAMWRPPPNTDGTPNESVDDVFVRVRQLLSKLETQYQGEDVVIVGADSDCLSVLQSFVLGEELGKHSKYYLRPGEGRQLRVSVDTEIGYRGWREIKSESFRGGEADKSGLEFSAVAGRSESGDSTAVVTPPRV